MEDLLKEVLDEQKPYLKKYENHNVRTKNVKFFPFKSVSTSSEEVVKLEDKKEETVIDSSLTMNDLALSLKKRKEEGTQTELKVEDKNVLPIVEEKVDDKLEKEKFFLDEDNWRLGDFALLANSKFKQDNKLRAKENAEKEAKRKDASSKKKIITETYLYLFRNFLNYSLVFDEFPEFVRNFPKFLASIPKVTTTPKRVRNVKDFVYKLRTVSLIQKMNIIAYQIGQYNLSLIVDEVYDVSVLTEYTPEDLAVVVYDKYKGSDLDYEALLTFYDIVDADMNGKIIFDEKVETNEKRKEVVKVADKKEQRRKTLGFGSFSLKK